MATAGRKFTSLASSGALLASLLTGAALVVAPAPVAMADRPTDAETGCQERYDSAVVGKNPIMFQRIINHIPQGVAVSTLKEGSVTRAPEIVTRQKPVWLGQRTPYMDGANTLTYKKWTQRHSGEGWPADHWPEAQQDRHTVGCFIGYPFLIGPGEGKPRLIDYDGKLYGRDGWRGKATWWGIPKRYEQVGAGGFSTWTCRGDVRVPSNANLNTWKDESVYWARTTNGGSYFFGDSDTDRVKRDAGRAPGCENSPFEDMQIKPYFQQEFYGDLTDTARNDNRCESTSANDIVGCWQRIYTGPFERSWRTETNVFTASMLANLRSYAQINVPSEYRAFGGASRLRLAWAISDVEIDGAWPDGFDQSQAVRPQFNMATGETTVSEYTVPGSIQGDGARDEAFKFGGWIETSPGVKTMRLRLTATTDGTYQWPVCQAEQDTCVEGEPMSRPQIQLVFRYELNNFDKLRNSCTTKSYLKASTKYYTRDRACIIGMVPTLFEVSDSWELNNRFEPKRDDKGKPISTVDDVKPVPLQSQNWVTTDLKVQVVDFSRDSEGTGTVGANVRWNINLTGVIDLVR